MTDLSNSADWVKIYDAVTVAEPNPKRPGKYYPIPILVVSELIDSHTIAVLSSCSNGKPGWRFGATVFPVINIGSLEFGNARTQRSYSVGYNLTTIIKLERVSTYYRVGVLVPRYFNDVHLQVWVFVGIEDFQSVDEKIDQIQTDLIRIESKVDGIARTGNP